MTSASSARPGFRHARKRLHAAVVFAGLASGLACSREAPRPPRSPPNVVLVLVDTLRADHLGAWGYERKTSPHLDRLASEATVFDRATSQAPHTLPSVAQIMTSRYLQGTRVDPRWPTLAEILAAAGYQTAAIVENANFELTADARGLARGFDDFRRNGVLDRESLQAQHWKTNTPADVITAEARRWIEGRDRDRPFLLWLHYFDPHDPYSPPFFEESESWSWQEVREQTGDIRATPLFNRRGGPDPGVEDVERERLVALYDAEIHYVDAAIGDLFATLEKEGLYDEALVVVGSDHGESLGEHGFWNHGVSLYQPEVHVPLIIKYPRQEHASRRRDPAENIDILPTIVAALGLPRGDFDGVDLATTRKRAAYVFWKGGWVVRTERWKLMVLGDRRRLFDLRSDPLELEDLASARPGVVDGLGRARRARLEEIDVAAETLDEASDQILDELRALGYLR